MIMKKNRNTFSYIVRMLSMTLLSLLSPSCRILGLSIGASSPKVAESKTSAILCEDNSDTASSFGVW